MASTTKGFHYPVSGDGRPHIDQAIAALAVDIDTVLDPMPDTAIGALAGAALWDGRSMIQSDVGAVRKWRGLYEYLSSGAAWRPMAPVSAHTAFTPALTAATANPNTGGAASFAGWYQENGRWVWGRASIGFGGVGTAVGTGTWFVSLPIADGYASHIRTIGSATWGRGSAPLSSSRFHGELELVTSTTAKIVGDSGTLASTNVPFTAGQGQLYYAFRYRRS